MLKILIISPIIGIISISNINKILKFIYLSFKIISFLFNLQIIKYIRSYISTYLNKNINLQDRGEGRIEERIKETLFFPINTYIYNNKIEGKIEREIGIISGIITYYISMYILLKYNNNNIEYQLRDTINLNWYQLNIGIDGISLILILLTTFLFPILFILIPSQSISIINQENKLEKKSIKYKIFKLLTKGKEFNKNIIRETLKEERFLIKILLFLEIIILLLFCTLDIFLFYLIFEILLIPFFILISQYGSKEHLINNKDQNLQDKEINNNKERITFINTKSLQIYRPKVEDIEIKNKIKNNIINKITKTSMEATKRFFFYSLFGSLFLFISIILIFFICGSTNNEIILYFFSLSTPIHLFSTQISQIENIIFLKEIYRIEKYIFFFIWFSFFITFAIKIPIFPFHSWLPLAHSEANTIGSILLAAILLKIGSYGIFRYMIELFSQPLIIKTSSNTNLFNFKFNISENIEIGRDLEEILDKIGEINENLIINKYFYPIIITFCTLSIIFGSFSTIRQIDIKRIIAYSSIVHMNYSIISIFSLNNKSLIGGAYLIISHAFISSGLFLLIGILYLRYSTRIYYYYQYLVNFMPLFTTFFFLFILNLISIPFSSSFISEFLILSGLLKSNFFICILLSFSLFS